MPRKVSTISENTRLRLEQISESLKNLFFWLHLHLKVKAI